MIRPYAPADLAALRRVCLLTARAGTDATGQYSDDDLLPDIFVEAYVTLEPDLAWTVEIDGRPVGFAVSTMDTRELARRWPVEFGPVFAERHPRELQQPGEEWLFDWGETAEGMVHDIADEFPAHFHIDLLPEAQGKGFGRALLRQVGLAAVASRAPGVHLAMDPENAPALAFYQRLGFRELGLDDGALVLGIASEALAGA
ncbi:N-acetyltransferase [soil metagenome]